MRMTVHVRRWGWAICLSLASGAALAQSVRSGWGSTPYADELGTGVTFRVWAPNATNVAVRGDFNTWTETALIGEGGGRWSVDMPDATVGQQYRYFINGTTNKRDPRARRVTNSGTNGVSYIYDSEAFDWGGTSQPKPARKDTVIYQMHVGTFAGSPTPRTFDHATNLLDHVASLGVNVVQVMPVSEFAGSQSWGYNPADLFAIESSYGGPDAFKRFVRACHERGMAVFVDVVHNHYGPSDLSMWRFDGWYQGTYGGIYFYNDTRANTPWGGTRPDYGRAEVRSFIRDHIMMLVNEYRIGGFRWDAPYYIINSDQGHNQTGEHMLRDINWELSQNYSYVQRIAEDNAFDYSMNFQGQWDVASRWSLHGQVTTASDANRNMFTVRNLLRDWASHNRVLFSEAHDYVASNHGRSRLPSEIDTGNPESMFARKRSLLAAGLVMTAPAIPMIFQGQEMLETQAFHDNVPLRWERTNTFAGIVRAYADLIHVRRNLRGGTKGLKGTGINVHHVDNNNKVVGFIRWDAGGQTDDVVVIANMANREWTNGTYAIGFPANGVWYRHFNSDSTNYQADFGDVGASQLVVSNGEARVNMGRYSVQIFTREAPTGEPDGPGLPLVSTAPIHGISNSVAFGGGEVADDGGAPVTERGLVWSASPAPTTNDQRQATGAGTGHFTNTLSGLTSGTVVYVRAYAINSEGAAYGSEISFVAGVAPSVSAVPLVGGVAVLEAEWFAENISPRSDHQWVFTNDVAGFSGDGFMHALPDTNFAFTNWPVTSPELRYPVVFNHATTHYVWVRGYGFDGTSDSVHWGLNGATNASAGLNWTNYNQWVWTNRVTAGSVATLNITSTGTNMVQLWMREDGARIDRVAIATNAGFRPRIGNAWHIPGEDEPVGQYAMRTPFAVIYSNTAVTIFSGNQFQGGGSAGDQTLSGSTVYYKHVTSSVWSAAAMAFHSTSGNNKYYAGVIPAGLFQPGDTVEYYVRINYTDFLPTYLFAENGAPQETDEESVARAQPYRYSVLNTPSAGFPSPSDWRDINIYQIFTDRFFDGDPSNNTAHPGADYVPSAGNRVHGGDFKGIERKLDYIKALGANAIWIKPIHLNVGNAAYHGYNAHDFYELAPNLGTMDELRSMVAAAHARGMYVVLDIVCNHQGRRIDSTDAGFPAYNAAGYTPRWTDGTEYPPPFNSLDDYHPYGHVDNYSDPTQVVLGELNGLDDLKTETLRVRTNLVEIFKFWIELADLDGFRLDTVKHVEIDFWPFFNSEIRAFATAMGKTNFIQFGEMFDTTEAGNGRFTGTQAGGGYANDTVLNFPLYGKVGSVFASASGNTKQIEDHYNAIPANYHPDSWMRLVNFLDNHDVRRFMHSSGANGNTNRLQLALSFLYTSRGIPNLYYGTEQNFNGGDDPENREDMFDGEYEQGPSLGDNFDMTKGEYLQVARLNNFRRLYPSLRTGEHVNRWNDNDSPGLFAYSRRLMSITQEVLVVLNTAGSAQTLTNRNTIYPAGTELVNLYNTNEIIVVVSTTTPPVTVQGTSHKVFVARNQWRPLDPVVRQQAPGHGAASVSPTGSLVLTFSKPMDTNSVQGAFRLDPPATGSFGWSVDRTVLTFTPSGPAGLWPNTRYTIRVETNAVDLVDGNGLFAPYESFIETASYTDTDGDGTPDWWMSGQFGQPTGAVANLTMAWQDADGDGLSNLDEYVADTLPTDSNSVFQIEGLSIDSVTVWSSLGRSYDIEANNITDDVWSVVVSNQIGTGNWLIIPESNHPPTRWYRSRVRLRGGVSP